MDYLHPLMSAALGPFMPSKTPPVVADGSALNDDDVYLVNVTERTIIRRIGRRSEYSFTRTAPVPVGFAALTGMQCKSLLG